MKKKLNYLKKLLTNIFLFALILFINPLISKSQINGKIFNKSLGNIKDNFSDFEIIKHKLNQKLGSLNEYLTLKGTKDWSKYISSKINKVQNNLQNDQSILEAKNLNSAPLVINSSNSVSNSFFSPPSILKWNDKNVRELIIELEESHTITKNSILTLTFKEGKLLLNNEILSEEKSQFYSYVMSCLNISKITRDPKGNIYIE